MTRFRCLAATTLLVALAACNDQASAPPGAPGAPGQMAVDVGYVVLKSANVPRTSDLPGRVVARATAEIRPQVDGIVRSIDFTEGRRVKKDDVLFHLNDEKFNAAYLAADAAVAKANASLTGAQATFDRTRRLADTNAVSQQTLDDARTSLLQAQADVSSAEADRQTAQINRDNTVIRAPIDGIIGTSSVSVGSLVIQNQTDAMATIQQIDPVNVDLVDTAANLLSIREEVAAGTLSFTGKEAPPVKLTLENGQPYAQAGTVSLANVNISESTGTFTVRATFPNPDRLLLPGMFVRATLDFGNIKGALLVPQRAVQRNATGKPIAYVVSADRTAEERELTTTGSQGNDWVVTRGVAAGDKLIIDGFQKISAGAKVNPVEATLDDDGVARQTLPDNPAANASPPAGAKGSAQ